MKVIKAFPPNWLEIAKVFPVKGQPGILYAYGDRLYNPSGVKVTPWIMAHEEVHGERQLNLEPTYLTNTKGPSPLLSGVDGWWSLYFASPGFRLTEELLAHQAEWHAFKLATQSHKMRGMYLDNISQRLSSPLYGNLISYAEAKKRITE